MPVVLKLYRYSRIAARRAGCRRRLRRWATSLKVTGSLPKAVIEIFHCLNPSGSTMVVRSTQPITEMSTKDLSLG